MTCAPDRIRQRIRADVRRSETPASVLALAHAAEVHALRFWRVVDPDDVFLVFEATDGGVASIVIANRQDATANDTDDQGVARLLRAAPPCLVVLVLAADGSAHVVPTVLTRINCGGGVGWPGN